MQTHTHLDKHRTSSFVLRSIKSGATGLIPTSLCKLLAQKMKDRTEFGKFFTICHWKRKDANLWPTKKLTRQNGEPLPHSHSLTIYSCPLKLSSTGGDLWTRTAISSAAINILSKSPSSVSLSVSVLTTHLRAISDAPNGVSKVVRVRERSYDLLSSQIAN